MANSNLKPEDLPVEKIVDLFAGMPCEFTEDDFRVEIESDELEQALEANARELSDRRGQVQRARVTTSSR